MGVTFKCIEILGRHILKLNCTYPLVLWEDVLTYLKGLLKDRGYSNSPHTTQTQKVWTVEQSKEVLCMTA